MALTAEGLPKQVQEQADLAEEFMSTLYGEKEEEDIEKTQSEEASSDGEEEEVAAPEVSADDEEEEEVETASEGTQDDDSEEESYRKRYETLQGKYNAEVPKLNQELRQLKDDIFERFGDLSKQVNQPEVEETDDTDSFEEELEEYREQFGDDLVSVIEKVSARRAQSLLKEHLSPVSQKVDSVESAQIQSAQTAFKEDLDSKVEGDWRSLWDGKDEGFKDFLKSKEPNGYFTYAEVVNKANDNWDAEILSNVFNTYLNSKAKPTEDKKAAKEAENKVAEKVNQERVAPSRNKISDEPKDGEARIWTQADIAEFKEKDRRGKYSPEESEALWADFLRAPAEGRIVA